MTKPLVFMMGRSPAFLPVDYRYARNHMWAISAGEIYRFGLTAYAVRLLGDLRRLEWSVDPGMAVARGEPIGCVEGSKAVSDLYAPADGVLVELNRETTADPSLVNSDLYVSGWLFTMDCPAVALLSVQQYLEHLQSCWPVAQRMLKGQASRQDGRA